MNLIQKRRIRRGMLSTVASLYDPLGFAAPVTLEAKALLQVNKNWIGMKRSAKQSFNAGCVALNNYLVLTTFRYRDVSNQSLSDPSRQLNFTILRMLPPLGMVHVPA